MTDEPNPQHKGALGAFIRQQRELMQLSLRELARMSQVSNAYLSQIERGLHEPSVRVLQAVSEALAVPVEEMLANAQPTAWEPLADDAVEVAIRADRRLSTAQKEALLAVYASYIRAAQAENT
ncbi:helix-turn-helix domain-containing protein [Smaragdicoccus niigatensis]|uniref:helix-turn-helix domain-containing protein n=1 Tax=Smaragdicoccus niigatensis TaxID=359359 RepID=UPI00037062E3|nr:helix-turn-helix transcriptional regulator [Smaragdicoccus niigatensis]